MTFSLSLNESVSINRYRLTSLHFPVIFYANAVCRFLSKTINGWHREQIKNIQQQYFICINVQLET